MDLATPSPSGEPSAFAPADRFLQRRRGRARELASFLADAAVVAVDARPQNLAGRLAAGGVAGLLHGAGIDVHGASIARVSRGTAAGDLLIVPPPQALGVDGIDEAVGVLARATRSFDLVLLIGWSCPTPTPRLCELLSRDRVRATVPDAATYASLKAHGRVELDLDPVIYFPGFNPSLRDPRWAAAFDGATSEEPRGDGPLDLRGDDPRRTASHDELARLFDDLAASDTIVTDQWHVVLSSLLLGRHVDYLDGPEGMLRSRLDLHFGGGAGPLATPRDATWVARALGRPAEGR